MSSSRAPEPELAMADLVESGRVKIESAGASYAAARVCDAAATKDYERALELLTMAMRSCPCARGTERHPCTCKCYEEVGISGESIFEEAMLDHETCGVPWKYSKCDNVHHIQALDLRAAMYEATGKLDLAVRDAEWMLELAPQLPDGYIRLGNLVRLRNNGEHARNLYKAGIDANRFTVQDSSESSPKLQQLHALHRQTLRLDPLRMPAEIVGLIFSYLSWTEILRVLRVSKNWKRVLTSPVHGRLWRNIIFAFINPGSELMPSYSQMHEILSWAGDGGARKIVVKSRNCTDALLTQLLEASPGLEYLELDNLSSMLPSNKKIWNQLRNVIISSDWRSFNDSEVDSPGGLPQMFLQNAASSLEHLNLSGIPLQWYRETSSLPLLPKLKTLQVRSDRIEEDYAPFPIFHFSVAFPRLEQLWIVPDIPYLAFEPVEIWRGNWDDVWPHLKVLKFQCFQSLVLQSINEHAAASYSSLRYLMSLNSLQHVSLDFKSEDWPRLFSGSHGLLSDLDVSQYPPSKNLRHFEVCASISPEGARTLVSNAIETGQLTSFDIFFPERPDQGYDRDTHIRHLKGYNWLRGASSIHTLGCYEFRFPLDAETDEDLPLPQFLATFPNLRTLKISSWEYRTPEFVKVVVAVLRVTHLKTIYTDCVDGVFLDQLKETAQQYGVQVLFGFPIEQWPMPLEP
ncbi:uncharacterized protein CPUR_07791 [Claviceps purpurea 20.1]|uniref:F-box domain-containing protein n=1 Tax=Claviceps purpurea (strain 20.1) TaxID=1111077 RepID=M1WFQ3_CLAP2|nr:uncharacterized protein CPUR_07791 [Claviceps purpurea 20.1]